MSTYTNFAIVGAGRLGKVVIDEFLKLKADGAVSSVTLVTRSVCCSYYTSLTEPSLSVSFPRLLVTRIWSQRASSTLR